MPCKNHDLSIKVAQHDALRIELPDSTQRYHCRDLEGVSQCEQECREQLQQAQQTVETLNVRLLGEQSKSTSLETRYTTLQKMNQTLKAEPNNFKQKSESLSKEIGRICCNSRTINDLEKLIADEGARREEVAQLIAQKRKALEDLHHYQTALEQCRLAQEKSKAHGSSSSSSLDDHNWMRVLERSIELERIVSELTEYVSAMERQLETLKQVNGTIASFRAVCLTWCDQCCISWDAVSAIIWSRTERPAVEHWCEKPKKRNEDDNSLLKGRGSCSAGEATWLKIPKRYLATHFNLICQTLN